VSVEGDLPKSDLPGGPDWPPLRLAWSLLLSASGFGSTSCGPGDRIPTVAFRPYAYV